MVDALGGDSQWQSATTDESQKCAFRTYKWKERLTLKTPFRLFKKGHWKQWMEISPKTSPSSQPKLFRRDSPDCSDFYLINPKSDWALPALNHLLPSSLFGYWKKCLHRKGLCIRIKRKTDISGIFDLTLKSPGVLSRKAQMTVRQVYTSSLDSLKVLTELGRLDLWQQDWDRQPSTPFSVPANSA